VDVLQSTQAEVEGEIAVARRAFGIVVEALAVEPVRSVGLKRNEDVSGTNRTKAEGLRFERRIVFGMSPAPIDDIALLCRQRVEPRAIAG
jgi:hypothetical protein